MGHIGKASVCACMFRLRNSNSNASPKTREIIKDVINTPWETAGSN